MSLTQISEIIFKILIVFLFGLFLAIVANKCFNSFAVVPWLAFFTFARKRIVNFVDTKM